MTAIKKLIAELDEWRRGSRPDVARELSIAITHLEDAAFRIANADLRETLRPADADQAATWASVVAQAGIPENEPTPQQEGA